MSASCPAVPCRVRGRTSESISIGSPVSAVARRPSLPLLRTVASFGGVLTTALVVPVARLRLTTLAGSLPSALTTFFPARPSGSRQRAPMTLTEPQGHTYACA